MLKRKNNPPPKPAKWATWEEIAGFFKADDGLLRYANGQEHEFLDAWAEFCGHRLRIRKPMTERTVGRIIRQLEKMGHDRAIESLHYSIDGGYPAVYEPKGAGGQRKNPSPPAKATRADRGEYAEPQKPLRKL